MPAPTNDYGETRKIFRDRLETDRKPEGEMRATSMTGRGYEDTMKMYYTYADEERQRERDRERDRDRERERDRERDRAIERAREKDRDTKRHQK